MNSPMHIIIYEYIIIFKSKYSYKSWLKTMKKELKQNQQIIRIMQRDQVINYKKKLQNKCIKQSDDQIESANSFKSGVFSQDSLNVRGCQDNKGNKKNVPLPQLYKEKRRYFYKGMPNIEHKVTTSYQQKQVRQHDNLVLKQKNNHLTTQNMKLKTKIMGLQKQLMKITKNTQDQLQKNKPGLIVLNNRIKCNQLLSLKITLKNLRKELDQQKKQNQKIKFSVKFTHKKYLQKVLDLDKYSRNNLPKKPHKKRKHLSQHSKQQGLTGIQQKYQTLADKNMILSKQNNELKVKLKSIDETSKKLKQVSQNQKNLNKMLFNAKKLLKQKQRQIQQLKIQPNRQAKIDSSALVTPNPMSDKQSNKVHEYGKNKSLEKRVMSKSAQKYRKRQHEEQHTQCKNCAKLKQKIQTLQKKIQELNVSLKNQKENNMKIGNLGQFSREQIDLATSEQVSKLSRFLIYRFQAHHLTFEQAPKYLINGQITQDTKKQQVSLAEISENLVAEPFSVLSSRYLEICLIRLFYPQQCQKNIKNLSKVKLDENKKLSKSDILVNFSKIIVNYTIMNQQKQQQMFIQIAQLVTNYHQHILTALNRKKNGQGTISQQQLTNFFNEIELEKQFVDFILCQIILESLDLEHLNFYTIFEIFYMPAQVQNVGSNQPIQPNKKKFEVDHCQVVKEQDQQYQQSKSHLETKKRPQSKKEEEEGEDQEHLQSISQHSEKHAENEGQSSKKEIRTKRNKSLSNVEARLEKQRMKNKKNMNNYDNLDNQYYEQLFDEEKLEKSRESEPKDNVIDPIEQQYKDQFN